MHPNVEIYDQVFAEMEKWFASLLATVAPPKQVPFGDSFLFRFTEHTAQQAVVQKLARLVVGLRSAYLLLSYGQLQDQGAIERILDEVGEDILFLSGGIIGGLTPLHQEYLRLFNMEDYAAPGKLIEPMKGRPQIERKKIRAANSRFANSGDPNTELKAAHSIHRLYSGYVHASAPNIMDMYGGAPSKFYLRGMLGTARATEHLDDIWNYFFRGISAFAIAAFAFDMSLLGREISAFRDRFEKASVRRLIAD
jgi:hypothetical protein